MQRTAQIGEFTKEYINSISKTIDENECWESEHTPNTAGQVQISINGHLYVLSRVVMCLWNDISYYDNKIITRHKCNNRICFNPDHVIPGNDSENQLDAVKAGTHHNASKTNCSKCGGPYSKTKTRKNGKFLWQRYCKYCSMMRRRVKK